MHWDSCLSQKKKKLKYIRLRKPHTNFVLATILNKFLQSSPLHLFKQSQFLPLSHVCRIQLIGHSICSLIQTTHHFHQQAIEITLTINSNSSNMIKRISLHNISENLLPLFSSRPEKTTNDPV